MYGGREEVRAGSWWGNFRDRDHLQEHGIVGKIMLKWFLKKSGGRAWNGLICLIGSCECCNEPSGSIKWEFLS